MKKLYLLYLITFFSISPLVVADVPDYSGFSVKGYVRVDANGQSMSAVFNVRYAPAEGEDRSYVSATVNANHYSGTTVSFSGHDGRFNNNFYCYVDSANPIFDTALKIASSVGDGTRLYVYKRFDSIECLNVYMDNKSYYQH